MSEPDSLGSCRAKIAESEFSMIFHFLLLFRSPPLGMDKWVSS
jgi:hypothetical protein